MTLRIRLPKDELESVSRLLAILDNVETDSTGQIFLRSDGIRRLWYATDRYRAVRMNGGSDNETYAFGVSPAVFHSLDVLFGDIDELTLEFDPHGEVVTAYGDGVQFKLPGVKRSFPPFEEALPAPEAIAGHARIESLKFHQLVHAAQAQREIVTDEKAPDDLAPFWVYIENERLGLGVNWQQLGLSRYSVHAEGASGEICLQVNSQYLRSLITVFDPSDILDVSIPEFNTHPIVLTNGSTVALLMGLSSHKVMVRSRLEKVLEDEFGFLAKVPDANDHYAIGRRGTQIKGRLVEDEDGIMVLRLFANLLDECAESPDLLRELNDLNDGLSFTKLFLRDSIIVAEVDLLADEIEGHEIRTAAERIMGVAHTVIPTLAVVLGGRQLEDPRTQRLNRHRGTVVEAEVLPGQCMFLNGADAIEEWVFPGVVHVVTGWFPEGVELTDEASSSVNHQIAADILAMGGRFVLGAGHAPELDASEPSIVAWGISREQALDIGARASRDTIIEMDADEVRLVTVRGEVIEQRPRSATTSDSNPCPRQE